MSWNKKDGTDSGTARAVEGVFVGVLLTVIIAVAIWALFF